MRFKKEAAELITLRNNVSINIKFMGIVLSLVILLGFWVALQVRSTLAETMREQLKQQGIAIARDLASRSTDYIFNNNIFTLYEINQETLINNADIRYSFIIDSSGRVLVHSFGRSLPKGLRDINEVKEGQKYNIEIINTDEGIIHDIAVPIFEGRAGFVRVGMSESSLNKAIGNTAKTILFSTIVVAVLGISLAYWLTTLITRPIFKLVRATQDVTKGNLKKRVSLDEFKYLGNAFNEMIESIERSRNENARLWEELKNKEEMRIRLLDKVITAQEEERKRIARELHDQTSQSLTSLMLGIKALENIENHDLLKAKTDELRALTGKTLEEIRDLAINLRPSVLDDLGLEAAVQGFLKGYSHKNGIEVDIHTKGIKDLRLPSRVETAFYRIVQEAMTNIVKHAMAKYVAVIMERRNNTLVLIVEDDGRGFDVKEVMEAPLREKRLGLFGMEERVSLLGGSFSIESVSGFGTTLYVNVPLEEGEGNV